MQSFIDLLIRELIDKNRDLSSDCIVFPTRRAGLIFKKKFASHISKPAWLPAVYSIDDLISFLSPYKVAGSTQLVIELFTVYKKLFPQVSFDKYIPWGEMLLKDFNEADLQMVNVKQLFSEVVSLREIDALIGVNDEESERIREFWKLFSNQEISRLKEAFLDNWRSLPQLYSGFTTQLKHKKLSYSGMAARTVASGIAGKSIAIPWPKIYFAGFYALSNAEKIIFNKLAEQDIAEIFWDADRYYSEDKKQEAGKYFRKNQVIGQAEHKWTFDYLTTEERKIDIIGVPLHVGQAKYTGILLRDQHQAISSFDHTAVVIPDEKLLMPVLYSMPSDTDSINVTMGYPVQGSTTEQLVKQIKTWRTKKNSFHAEELRTFLENIFISSLDPVHIKEWIYQLKTSKQKWFQSPPFGIHAGHPVLQLVFSSNGGSTNVAAWLAEILLSVLRHYHGKKNIISRIDLGLLRFFYEELDKLSRLIGEYKDEVDFSEEACWRLIQELLRSLRVPFSGEPVKGLQIMGFLETRNLDFENLYVLSVNEEVMPGSSSGNSYIPFAVRKAYGMPTHEEQDAIYAYHFYRLLQRSRHIRLIYNTVAGNFSGGEKSRFLLQLAYELKKKAGDKVTLTHQLVGTDLQAVEIKEIVIKKDPVLLEELKMYFDASNEKSKRWSATAFTSYIACTLQFYYRYVAGIREPDEVKAEIDPAVFGSILHLVMEQLYQSQQTITADFLESRIPLAGNAVEDAIRSRFPSAPGNLTGKNSLLKTVMTDLVKKILLFDKSEAPVIISGLEEEYSHTWNLDDITVNLYGKIDRVDEKNEVARIIDYKTGKDVAAKDFTPDKLFTDTGMKASFQLLFYVMLFKKKWPGRKVKAGIFRMQSISQGIDFLNGGAEISDLQMTGFEAELKKLVSGILDPAVDFRQTTDLKTCTFCPYKDICNR